jgi:hypothetical protein
LTAEPIWLPDPDQTPRPQIADFTDFANQRTGQAMAGFDDLWQWSVDDLDGFWGAVWDFFDVIADEPLYRGARRPVHARGHLVPRHPAQLRRTRTAGRPR